MGNLRDELLKAKLVSEKDVQKAKRDEFKKKEEVGRRAVEDQKKKESETKEASARARRDEDRRREADRQRNEKERQTKFQARDIARKAALGKDKVGGTRRFYFIARDRRVPFLELSQEAALDLEHGKLAIVEVEGRKRDIIDWVVVPREAAQRVQALDAEAVRFLN